MFFSDAPWSLHKDLLTILTKPKARASSLCLCFLCLGCPFCFTYDWLVLYQLNVSSVPSVVLLGPLPSQTTHPGHSYICVLVYMKML